MGLNNISKEHPEKKCIGIYLSKLPITKPGETALLNSDIFSINIDNNNSDNMNYLIERLLEYFHYVFRIYSYEYDESLIMRHSLIY